MDSIVRTTEQSVQPRTPEVARLIIGMGLVWGQILVTMSVPAARTSALVLVGAAFLFVIALATRVR